MQRLVGFGLIAMVYVSYAAMARLVRMKMPGYMA